MLFWDYEDVLTFEILWDRSCVSIKWPKAHSTRDCICEWVIFCVLSSKWPTAHPKGQELFMSRTNNDLCRHKWLSPSAQIYSSRSKCERSIVWRLMVGVCFVSKTCLLGVTGWFVENRGVYVFTHEMRN